MQTAASGQDGDVALLEDIKCRHQVAVNLPRGASAFHGYGYEHGAWAPRPCVRAALGSCPLHHAQKTTPSGRWQVDGAKDRDGPQAPPGGPRHPCGAPGPGIGS